MSKSREFSKNIIEELGYYVYIYSDPDTRVPFYIGKGKGNRCFSHLSAKGDSEKVAKIEEIRKRGKEPVIEILVYGVDEDTALKVEAAAIDLIGIDNLTNIQQGHHSGKYGRTDVDDINAMLGAEELKQEDITDDLIMIRINKSYHYGMTQQELYDYTRCCWTVNPENAKKAKYALSIYNGIVLEVYRIIEWLPGFTTLHTFDEQEGRRDVSGDRWEFIGNIAEEDVRKKYIHRSVAGLFSPGAQMPFKYFIHS